MQTKAGQVAFGRMQMVDEHHLHSKPAADLEEILTAHFFELPGLKNLRLPETQAIEQQLRQRG